MSEFITEEGKEILAKYDSVIRELVEILTPHIRKMIVAELTSDDQSIIFNMIKAEVSEEFNKYDLESSIISVIDHYNFDDIVETRCDDLGLLNKDEIEEMIKDHEPELDLDTYKFADAVKDVVRNMDISVEVN
jgi:hypothetical protein